MIKKIAEYAAYGVVFFLSAVAVILWQDARTPESNRVVSGNYEEYGVSSESPLVIYTISTCPACQKLKADLDKQGVSYMNKDIQEREKWGDEYGRLDVRKVPVILFNDTMIVGYDRSALKSKLRQLGLVESLEPIDS